MHDLRRFAILALVVPLTLSACGSDDDASTIVAEPTVATTAAVIASDSTEAPLGSTETCAIEGRTIETAITAANALEGEYPDPADRTIAGMLSDPVDDTRWTYIRVGDTYTLVGIGPCVGNSYPSG